MIVTIEHIISAIIGHWRNGASVLEIKSITEVPISVISKIISEYEIKCNDIKRET